MNDFTNFRAVYDDLTDEVMRAKHQFVADHLANWFREIDETPRVNQIVAELQDGLGFDAWYKEQVASVRSFVGSGKIVYPSDRDKALGMKLLLFREVAAGNIELWRFANDFIASSSTNINELTYSVLEQIFAPMARELRRLLEQRYDQVTEVPAADRVVTVDHNSKVYQDADAAMENLEKAIREANDFQDPLEKEQREAEVSAARRLMKAARVAIETLVALVRPVLRQFGTKVKDNLVAAAALTVSTALTGLFGAIFGKLLGLF